MPAVSPTCKLYRCDLPDKVTCFCSIEDKKVASTKACKINPVICEIVLGENLFRKIIFQEGTAREIETCEYSRQGRSHQTNDVDT